jgi:hypothetical protein
LHPACSPAADQEPWRRADDLYRSISPPRDEATEAPERLTIAKRGQALGFGALILTLGTIVTLAAIGQPWVAGIVATTGLATIVAIFVTGTYQPAPIHIRDPTRQPTRPPQQE